MTTKVLSVKTYGPYWTPDRTEVEVNSLSELIYCVRGLFEERVDAIAILKEDQVTAVWACEPGIDCDCDGFYELASAYPGQDYELYRRDERSFWTIVLYNFGIKSVQSEVLLRSKTCVAA